MKWTFAKTYAQTAPHEWILRKNEPELFRFIARMLKGSGTWEWFHMPGGKPYRVKYWYRGHYRYWIMGDVINRTRVGWKYPVSLTGPNPWMYRPAQWSLWHRQKGA